MANSLSDGIKSALDMEQVARFYGFEPNRSGFILCPFHGNDRTPSLKIYQRTGGGFHCHACGKGGSVIDFTMELFQINFQQACVRLDNDFRLGLTGIKPDRKAQSEAIRKRREEQRETERIEAEQLRQAKEHQLWWTIKRVAKPGSYWWAAAVENLLYLDYLLEEEEKGRWMKSENLRKQAGSTP